MIDKKLTKFELWLIYFHFIICSLMIKSMIGEGKIVPSEVTVKLLQKAMEESGNDKFLIDGFPRNDENRAAFEAVVSFLSHLFPLLSTCLNFIFVVLRREYIVQWYVQIIVSKLLFFGKRLLFF